MKTEWDYTNLADAYLKRPDYAPEAIKKMLEGQMIIIPGLTMKLAYMGERFLPKKALLCCVYHFQNKKG